MQVLNAGDLDIENGPVTKVVVVDDHSMVAEGLARIISNENDSRYQAWQEPLLMPWHSSSENIQMSF